MPENGSPGSADLVGKPSGPGRSPQPVPTAVRWRDAALATLFIVTLPTVYGYFVIDRYHWKWPGVLAGYVFLAVIGVWLASRGASFRRGRPGALARSQDEDGADDR